MTEKRKPGRPVGSGRKYTAEHAQQILAHIAAGGALKSICAEPGMPGLPTVLGWAYGTDNAPVPLFPDLYAQARQRQSWSFADRLVVLAQEARGGDMAHVSAVKLEVDTLKWWLSKVLPRDFGDRIDHQVSGSADIHIYLPEKRAPAMVIEGQTQELLEDGQITDD
jgi:hypothetical protein